MSALYCCALKQRLQAVRDYNLRVPPAQQLNAIEYLEIASADERTIVLTCLLSTAALTAANCRIDGGVRITGIAVTGVAVDTPAVGQITLSVDAAGDFSTYSLRFVDSSAPDQPVPGFDPRLASIDFSFKACCPAQFDCASTPDCAPAALNEPVISYLSKDYLTFRSLMLDRITALQPGGVESSPADLQVTLVETLAYAADHLSYYQDAVATEAYLGTARSRVSLRRHARLLDYRVHEGCNARVWLTFDYAGTPTNHGLPLTVPARTMFLTRGEAQAADSGSSSSVVLTADLPRILSTDVEVFESCIDVTLTAARSLVHFYTWSDADCWLPAGTTTATFVAQPGDLNVGDVLVFEEVLGPQTGLAADADPSHRQAVRLTAVTPGTDPVANVAVIDVAWDPADALQFALCLSAQIGTPPVLVVDVSVARANVVLADHGRTVSDVSLDPPVASDPPYRPRLPDSGLTYAAPIPAGTSAAAVVVQDPREALPSRMSLTDINSGTGSWQPNYDLLHDGPFTREFVVETENDGSARLRFGDDRFGMQPAAGTVFTAAYRLGGGSRGDVGSDSITRIVHPDLASLSGLVSVRNPLPAAGGIDPESADQIRRYAPQAFRIQERAVTETDYALRAEQYPGVLRAVARFRWTGSWYTVYIAVDRKGGLPVVKDKTFSAGLLNYIDQYRLAGYDLELRDPVYAPLDIGLQVCVLPDRYAADVQADVTVRLGTGRYHGQPAFFNADAFSFGDPLYLSRLVEAVLEVPGVASVKVLWFQRFGKVPNGELQAEMIQPQPLEVLRLDNDPSFPENGQLSLDMRGGQ
jgi:hypothetical protein